MELFNFPVEASPTGGANFKTLAADFGDGYTQIAGDGINTRKERWSVTVTGCLDGDIRLAKAFLDRHAGHKIFEWDTPLGERKYFRALEGYSFKKRPINDFSISTTFEEVHHP